MSEITDYSNGVNFRNEIELGVHWKRDFLTRFADQEQSGDRVPGYDHSFFPAPDQDNVKLTKY